MHGCTYIFVISDALFIAIYTRSERRYFKAPFYLTSSYFSIFIFSFWLSQGIQVTKQASFPTFHLNLPPVIHLSSQNPLQHYSFLVSLKDPLQVSVLILHLISFILVYQKALRYAEGGRHLSYQLKWTRFYPAWQFGVWPKSFSPRDYHQHFPGISLSIFPPLGWISVN